MQDDIALDRTMAEGGYDTGKGVWSSPGMALESIKAGDPFAGFRRHLWCFGCKTHVVLETGGDKTMSIPRHEKMLDEMEQAWRENHITSCPADPWFDIPIAVEQGVVKRDKTEATLASIRETDMPMKGNFTWDEIKAGHDRVVRPEGDSPASLQQQAVGTGGHVDPHREAYRGERRIVEVVADRFISARVFTTPFHDDPSVEIRFVSTYDPGLMTLSAAELTALIDKLTDCLIEMDNVGKREDPAANTYG